MARIRLSALLRPIVAVPALSLLVGGGVFAASFSPSSEERAPELVKRAAGSCTISIPTLVEIDKPSFSIPVSRGADCAAAGVTYAAWNAKQADGSLMEEAQFAFDEPYSWDIFDFQWFGTWTWHPAGASAPGDPALAKTDAGTPVPGSGEPQSVQAITIPQNTPKTDIRSKSTASLLAIRTTSTSVVSLRTNIVRYTQTIDGFAAWGGAKGQLQWRAPGTTTWNALKDVVADSSGNYNWSYTAPAGQRQYRVYYPSVQYIFGDESEYETV